jgi:putative endonuclease
MTWYVYIARCNDGSLYTGVTINPMERLQCHNAGRGSAYVRSKGEASLCYSESHPTKGSALRREHEIKSWRREKKLALIKSQIAGVEA